MAEPPSRRRGTRLALATLALLTLLAGASWAEDPPPTLEQADALQARGAWSEAAAAYEHLLEQAQAAGSVEPARLAPLRRGLGRSLLEQGLAYEALAPLEALARDGSDADKLLYAEALLAHVRAALAEGGRGAGPLAPYLEDAVRALEPVRQADALAARGRLLGEAFWLRGDGAHAVEVWRGVPRGSPPGPEDLWLLERLARALYDLGRPSEAAPLYREAGNERGAAAAFTAAREAGAALDAYTALLRAAPDDGGLIEEASAAARYLGGDAVGRLRTLLAAARPAPAAARAWLSARARLAEAAGDSAEASALLHEALTEAGPEEQASLALALARVLIRVERDGGAARTELCEVLERAFAAAPQDPRLREVLTAVAQRELSEAWSAWPDARPLQRSLALQRRLLEAAPDDALGWANLGNSLRMADGTAEALTAFERALALEPRDAAIRNDYGLALRAARREADAVTAFEQALADDPGLLAARQNLARSAWRAGDDAGTRAHLAAATRSARSAGAPWMLYRVLSDRAWRTALRPERR